MKAQTHVYFLPPSCNVRTSCDKYESPSQGHSSNEKKRLSNEGSAVSVEWPNEALLEEPETAAHPMATSTDEHLSKRFKEQDKESTQKRSKKKKDRKQGTVHSQDL